MRCAANESAKITTASSTPTMRRHSSTPDSTAVPDRKDALQHTRAVRPAAAPGGDAVTARRQGHVPVREEALEPDVEEGPGGVPGERALQRIRVGLVLDGVDQEADGHRSQRGGVHEEHDLTHGEV